MTIKPGIKELLWMAAGAVMLLVVTLVVLHFRTEPSPAEQFAFKARRMDLVARLRMNLASASEAEKSAVLAVIDQDSQEFADQARTAAAEVERERKELGGLLEAGGTQGEKDLLARFSTVFNAFQRLDHDILTLAVKNSNIKAYGLAFGPAADAIKDMDTAFSRLMAKSAVWPEARDVALLALGAQAAALRIQVLLPPHIAEANDKKMDELEARMNREDREVRKNLDGLAAVRDLGHDRDVQTAMADYARFSEVRARILALSRENTNVRSIAMSLDPKRKVILACLDCLSDLQRAIQDEPGAAANRGSMSNPRGLEVGKY